MEPLGRCCFTQHTISLRSYVEAASCTDLVLIKAKRGLSTDAIIRSVIVFKKKTRLTLLSIYVKTYYYRVIARVTKKKCVRVCVFLLVEEH